MDRTVFITYFLVLFNFSGNSTISILSNVQVLFAISLLSERFIILGIGAGRIIGKAEGEFLNLI